VTKTEVISVNKRISLISLGAAATLTLIPFGGNAPLIAQAVEAGKSAINNVINRPTVKLNLVADKKVTQTDAQGNKKVVWEALANGATVGTGDVVRYTVTGANQGDRPAKNLSVEQPITKGLTYVADSAMVKGVKAEVTFSIDSGKTFSAKPTIAVTQPDGTVENKPAPLSSYSNVRWTFTEPVAPKAQAIATYQVAVR
jgi:uncharacterized repeat protein (TIGR01451 family)